MASDRYRSTKSIGNKLNYIDSKVGDTEKSTVDPHMGVGAISSGHLAAESVSQDALGARSITEDKVARGAIGTEHLGVVNQIISDSGLNIQAGQSATHYLSIEGGAYTAPPAGSLYTLAFDENHNVVATSIVPGVVANSLDDLTDVTITTPVDGYVLAYDAASSQWIDKAPLGSSGVAAMPAGSIQAWATNTAPEGWLLCDGAAVSRTTYSDLFATIGTTYGTGNGSTTFNLPNIKGRTIVARDSTQAEFNVIGEVGGEKTVTLTEAEMPVHTHIQDSHNHAQNQHRHSITSVYDDANYNQGNIPQNNQQSIPFDSGTIVRTQITDFTTPTNQAFTAVNQNSGSGQAHNNLQPYIVLNYIIKYTIFDGLKGDTGSQGIQGATGNTGPQGSTGAQGPAATIAVGTTTTGTAGSSASVTNSGSSSAATFNFTIPQGAQGATGSTGTTGATGAQGYKGGTRYLYATAGTAPPATGQILLNSTIAANITTAFVHQTNADSVAVGSYLLGITVNSVLSVVSNDNASAQQAYFRVTAITDNTTYVTYALTYLSGTVAFGSGNSVMLQVGLSGATGVTGTAATVAAGTTTTGAAGTSASVTNSGTTAAAVFNFTVPQGVQGPAATIAVGTTTTGTAGSSASVTNSGSSSAATFNFTVPRGADGAVTSVNTRTGAVTGVADLTASQTFTGTQTATPSAVAGVPLIAKGLASQTADLQQWQNSSGGAVASISPSGIVSATNYNVTVNTFTTASLALNFSGGSGIDYQPDVSLNTTFTGTGYQVGATKTVVLKASATKTLTFPTGWTFVGTKPTSISSGAAGILTVISLGTTESDCIAGWVS